MTLDEVTRTNAVELAVNPRFTQAVLTFRDQSHIRFEHSSRQRRWAQPSSDDTIAGRIVLEMSGFRLNAKHLQLFFEDGTTVEFAPAEDGSHGTTLAEA